MSYYKHTPPPEHARTTIREKAGEARATLDEHVPQFFEPTYEREDFDKHTWGFHILVAVVCGLMLLGLGVLTVVRYPTISAADFQPVDTGTHIEPPEDSNACFACSYNSNG